MIRFVPIIAEAAGYLALVAAAALVDLRLGLAVLGAALLVEGREASR